MEFFSGLDVHKESVQACVVDSKGNIVAERRFTTTTAGMNALLSTVQGSSCVMESSTACFPVYDFLNDRNIKVRVAHPKRTKAICSAKISTDKVDARTLAQLERVDLVPEAYIPSKEVRRQQDIVRHHVQLVQQKTRLKNQIKSILLRNGIRVSYNPLTEKASKLFQLANLPENLKLKLSHAKQQHDLLNQELKEANAKIEELAKQNKYAVILHSIPGVGWFSALLIALQIDNIDRFPDAEHLVSYAGLCPGIKQSADHIKMKGIGNDGCKLLRWVLIQDAWQATKRCTRFKKIYKKLCRRKSKQKAIVGIAKRLLTVMYFMLRDQTLYNHKKGGC